MSSVLSLIYYRTPILSYLALSIKQPFSLFSLVQTIIEILITNTNIELNNIYTSYPIICIKWGDKWRRQFVRVFKNSYTPYRLNILQGRSDDICSWHLIRYSIIFWFDGSKTPDLIWAFVSHSDFSPEIASYNLEIGPYRSTSIRNRIRGIKFNHIFQFLILSGSIFSKN